MKYNLNHIAKTAVKAEIEEQLNSTHFLQKSLSHQIIKKGVLLPSLDYDKKGLLPGGIIDAEGKYIESSAFAEGRCKPYLLKDTPSVRPEKVLFIGFFLNCYGHGITDNIKKLWWLKQNKWEGRIIYITERNAILPKWQIEIFRLAGFDTNKWEQITHPTQFKEILIPDNSIINKHEFRMYTKEYKQLIETIKKKIPQDIPTYEKIYFTRTGIKNIWREFGEHFVEAIYQKKGFTIISPEKLSVEKQIGLMMNCKSFVSTEGSCAHNTIFCPPHTKVTILRKADYANSYQMMINECANLDVTYIDVHHSSKANKIQPWHGPFYLCITKYLAEYLNWHYYIPYWAHLSYWIYYRQAWEKYKKFYNKK